MSRDGEIMDTGSGIDTKLKNAEKEIQKQLMWCIPLTTLAVLWLFLSWSSVFIPSNEDPEIWFQRSGSIAVLMAVWMEYNLMKISEDVNLSGVVTTQQQDLANKYKGVYRVAKYIAAALAFAGTFVWGYGDIIK